MSGLKPDITDEEIGIRSFQLRKRRAVERAMEKIRQKLSKSFSELNTQDVEVLQWVLGETWALMGQYEWDHIYFSNMDMGIALKIIEIGKEIITSHKVGYKGFEEVHQIIMTLESKKS